MTRLHIEYQGEPIALSEIKKWVDNEIANGNTHAEPEINYLRGDVDEIIFHPIKS